MFQTKLVVLAAVSLVFAFVGYVSAQVIEPSELEWEKMVEREIRKLDFWVEEEVEQDYTNNEKEAHASLKNIKIPKIKHFSPTEFAGAYNPETDTLLLPEFTDVQSRSQTLESLVHELWHALYDEEGIKGLLHSAEYKGPTLEEIASYCTKKVNGKDFQDLREKLKIAEEDQKLNSAIAKLTTHLNKITQSTSILKETEEYMQKNKELDSYILKEDKEKIDNERKKIGEKLTVFIAALENIVHHMNEWKVTTEDKKVTLEYLIKAREQFAKYAVELDQYRAIPQTLNQWKTGIRDIYETSRIRKYDKAIEELKKKLEDTKDEEEIEKIEELIEFQEFLKSMVIDQGKTEKIIETLKSSSLHDDISLFISSLATSSNIYQIDQILNNPNEVMARVIHSLYSLYFGEITDNQFSLDEDDLKFLERFTYKGKQLFRKGIEKYRIAQDLMKRGSSSNNVKNQLEYATFFIHNGKEYHWPEAQFTIKGKIPTINFFKDEVEIKK